ncbi:hypothetical protein EN35_26025 [Rhodococcus qingshengii]|nr:hypothetical protein EN35_26025 [Rhodococcus qingshengii]
MRSGLTRLHSEYAIEKQHTLFRPRRQIAVRRYRQPEILVILLVDITETSRNRPHVRGNRKAQPDSMTGRRIGVLTDDEHPNVVERIRECTQDVLSRRQILPSRSDLFAQELTHRGDLLRDRFECPRPPWIDDLCKRRHQSSLRNASR